MSGPSLVCPLSSLPKLPRKGLTSSIGASGRWDATGNFAKAVNPGRPGQLPTLPGFVRRWRPHAAKYLSTLEGERVLAITAPWLGVAISIGVSVAAFVWAIVAKISLSRQPPARSDSFSGRDRELSREIAMWCAVFVGCLTLGVALLIFQIAGLGP